MLAQSEYSISKIDLQDQINDLNMRCSKNERLIMLLVKELTSTLGIENVTKIIEEMNNDN